MDIKTKEMYSEVYSVLNLMEDEYVKRLPNKLYNLIKENRLETYNPVYDPDLLFLHQDIQRDSVALLVLLKLNYWCDTVEEKVELRALLEANSEKQGRVMKEQYSSQNMFKRINEEREKMEARQALEEKAKAVENKNQEMMKYKNENFITRLLNKVKCLISK